MPFSVLGFKTLFAMKRNAYLPGLAIIMAKVNYMTAFGVYMGKFIFF